MANNSEMSSTLGTPITEGINSKVNDVPDNRELRPRTKRTYSEYLDTLHLPDPTKVYNATRVGLDKEWTQCSDGIRRRNFWVRLDDTSFDVLGKNDQGCWPVWYPDYKQENLTFDQEVIINEWKREFTRKMKASYDITDKDIGFDIMIAKFNQHKRIKVNIRRETKLDDAGNITHDNVRCYHSMPEGKKLEERIDQDSDM